MDYHTYNIKNHFSLSYAQLAYWAKRHKKAKESNDTVKMLWIENMLTDINFHYECELFQEGQYEKALQDFKEYLS